MQVPLEVLFGPVGALGLALLWIWDLRQQNARLVQRLNDITDELRRAVRGAEPK